MPTAPLLGAWFDLFASHEWVGNWLTPVWLVGIGALAGMVLAALLCGVFVLLRNVPGFGRLSEIGLTLREGPLQPILAVVIALAVFGVIGTVVVRRPLDMLESLTRWPQLGTESLDFEIEPPPDIGEPEEQVLELDLRRSELKQITFYSDVPLQITFFGDDDPGFPVGFTLRPGEEFGWQRGQGIGPFPREAVDRLYVVNRGSEPAKLTMKVTTELAYMEVATAAYTAAGVLFLFLLYALQRAFMPRISAVALATYKSETAQPLFLILVAIGLFGVIIFEFIPYNTFGEDIKMLKISGLTLIMVFAIIQAIWAASTSISEEVEGRTALTVLSKPLGRRDFIIGKYLGILWTVAVMFIILGIVFMVVVAYKPIYDSRETSQVDPVAESWWQQCHDEMTSVVPGLLLGFMETAVLAALSVAVSTRLPMLANFIISFTIYVLGHITPLLAQSRPGQNEIVRFFGKLISTIFPVLEYYDIQAGIAGGAAVPLEYLGWMLLYTLLYSGIAMLLALILFEDRDLA